VERRDRSEFTSWTLGAATVKRTRTFVASFRPLATPPPCVAPTIIMRYSILTRGAEGWLAVHLMWTDILAALHKASDTATWVLKKFRALLTLCIVISAILLCSKLVTALDSSQKKGLIGSTVRALMHVPTIFVIIVFLAGSALLITSILAPDWNLWKLRWHLLRKSPASINGASQSLLDVSEVRRGLMEFSTDAVELKVIAGSGDFLDADPTQLAEIVGFGTKCRMIITPGKISKVTIEKLLKAGVDLRLYPEDARQPEKHGQLRGRLKRNANGMSACLFDRIGKGFQVVDLSNELLVRLASDEFDRWHEGGIHPLIKNVIFDIAGVAFDGDINNFFTDVLKLLPSGSITRASDYLNLDADLSLGKTDIVGVVEQRLGRSMTTDERHAVRGAWSNTWTLNPGTDQLIRSLRSAGYVVSFFSNCDKDNADVYQLKGYFDNVDDVFLSCQLGLVKPDQEFFEAILAKLHATPEECVVIDDARPNIEMAKKLGFYAIFVPRSALAKGGQAKVMAQELAKLHIHG
jgi:putative hydrolase of the HAD superfamily